MIELEFITQVIAGRRVTIPKSISDVLDIQEGDRVRIKILNVWHERQEAAAEVVSDAP